MKREVAMKLVENGITALNDALRAGHSETLERFLESLARFHNYSFNNALLIALQRPDATRVAGFHAWRKFGRFVKKGEHGIAIFAPMSRRKDRDERQQTTTEGEEAVFGFRIAYVFDVEQTEGDPLPEFAQVNGDAHRTGCRTLKTLFAKRESYSNTATSVSRSARREFPLLGAQSRSHPVCRRQKRLPC